MSFAPRFARRRKVNLKRKKIVASNLQSSDFETFLLTIPDWLARLITM